jgi:hypothetical protein
MMENSSLLIQFNEFCVFRITLLETMATELLLVVLVLFKDSEFMRAQPAYLLPRLLTME